MFFFNPFFNQLRKRGKVQKGYSVKTTKSNKWNNIGREIQQSIQGVLAKHGINYSR